MHAKRKRCLLVQNQKRKNRGLYLKIQLKEKEINSEAMLIEKQNSN